MILRRFNALAASLLTVALFPCCRTQNQVSPTLATDVPQKIVWAWERPEDLRFLDPKEFGVAFLAETIFLENDSVIPKPRRQPLATSPGTYIIAVTRIETEKTGSKRPTFSSEMADKIVSLIVKTLDLPDVRGVQIDFDAVVSEREFYRTLMNKLAAEIKTRYANFRNSQLTTHHSLTMTSLASWCTGDGWFNDFPVDEAVPMAFQMGADSEKIKTFLRNGNDWQEPLCRGSYGLSVEEGRPVGIKPGRRMYFFKNSAWTADDLSLLK